MSSDSIFSSKFSMHDCLQGNQTQGYAAGTRLRCRQRQHNRRNSTQAKGIPTTRPQTTKQCRLQRTLIPGTTPCSRTTLIPDEQEQLHIQVMALPGPPLYRILLPARDYQASDAIRMHPRLRTLLCRSQGRRD